MNYNEKFIDAVTKIVYTILGKEKLLKGEWHYGVIDSVIDSKHLKVFVDNSTTSQTISCNPDITFAIGDSVFVHFVNNDQRNCFIPYKRAI